MNDLPHTQNQAVLMHRSGSLALADFMRAINQRGEGIDKCRYSTWNSETGALIVSNRHCFDGRFGTQKRIIVLEGVTLSQSKVDWHGRVSFKTNQRYSSNLRNVYSVILALHDFDTMFISVGPQIILGPFFSRHSILKEKLQSFLDETAQDYNNHTHKGRALLGIIERNGGVAELCKIWNDLFSSEIQHKMLNLLPYRMLAPAQ